MKVWHQLYNDVAVINFSNPPVNALCAGNGLLGQVFEELKNAAQNPGIKAIVLQGDGELFSAGADIAEFESNPRLNASSIRELLELMDDIEKPLVAALHGMCLGGGLEIALGARARIARSGTKFGLPEVTLGILPGGGGTQRLPRLIGVAKALDMMLTGNLISAEEALTTGLVDRVVADELTENAIKLAREMIAENPLRPRISSLAISMGGEADIEQARASIDAKGGKLLARAMIIDCVAEVVKSSFADGLKKEGENFETLRQSSASRGLRHSFFAERAVAKIPNAARQVKRVESTAVVGAGTMGTGITISLLSSNYPVVLVEQKVESLERSIKTIERTINGLVDKKRISPDQARKQLALLTPAQSIEQARDADLVIEAVFEDINVKQSIFTQLDKIAKPSAILASNTSMLDINTIAGFTSRPENVLGTHFFSPANIMRLIEIVRGDKTSPNVLSTVMEFAKKIKKVGVVSGVCDGFIGNRMFEEMQRQAYLLLELGAFPEQIDQALESWGMAMGVLRVMDLAGNDIGLANRKRRAVEQPDRPYSKIPDIIAEQGRYGQKTGAGFYLYPDGSRTPVVDPQISKLILEFSKTNHIERRTITDQEILDRCLYALINEGAKILEEGIAYRSLDIDAVWTNGYGFPAFRGGPMFWADEIGIPAVLQRVEEFETGPAGWAWKPSDLLVKLASSGSSLASLND